MRAARQKERRTWMWRMMDNGGEEGEVESELRGPAYVGIGTGWTDDDDEDAFDAALSFSALDADSNDASPMPAMLVHPDSQMDEDATEDDDEMSWDEENEFAQGVFEVTHAWDGSVAFTNGFNDGQGLLDWAFEAGRSRRSDLLCLIIFLSDPRAHAASLIRSYTRLSQPWRRPTPSVRDRRRGGG
ncbi:hypothetical protein PENSPDRAFT_666078 [Peniophora sp. CONT]|nr:hypothetical protein PENSPDRAFT_666078 [Peniophora sp. CONT]